ncbi:MULTISPECIES: HAD family hydrolase [unclassified Pseudofrankia]|uniref:HAD family hydrolase n=1 Tax=unclassified Pseudofrankia TaxID=2994372 RepID=UPI0008D8EC16|nr:MULTISPECIES: HAD family hydrolase [unclassified Pseudofrankia]MDT3440120.1 HAD family hydrolase [Pseudofrankia sp. BMG5.37]OHV44728.1 haloacid dehalogenase [Pseudofrankia sp. BMG5.36]
MPRGVFFDLDDTLVDQRSAATAAVVEWAAGHGVTDELVGERWASISETHYARYQRREITFTEQRRARVREFLSLEVADDEADTIFAGYLVRYEAGWAAFDDAVPALRRARAAGLTVAIFTNGIEEQQRLKLTRLGLIDEIDLLITSSVLPAGKPDPRAFRSALDILGATADETLMVGDSLEKDIFGAVGAGISAVLVDRHGAHPTADVPRVSTLHDLLF